MTFLKFLLMFLMLKKFFFNEIELEIFDKVYYPREDSILLAQTLNEKKLKNKKCIEIGCGSGLISIVMAKLGAFVVSTDIDKYALMNTEKNSIKNKVFLTIKKSDLFDKIKEKFDFIVFNPPYLPNCENMIYTKNIKHQLFGGKTGRELIEQFLKQSKNRLNKNGKIFFQISTLTGKEKVIEICRKNNFSIKIIKRKKIPWEELMIFELVS